MNNATSLASKSSFNVSIFIVILLFASLAHVSGDIYVPSMPFIVKSLHSTTAIIQLSLFSFMAGYSVSHLFYGPLSDRIGRRTPMLMGIGISMLGTVLCFLAPVASILIIGRFIQGVGVAVCNSVGRSFVRDLISGSHLAKIASYLGMIMVLITATAPTVGGYIQYYFDWRMVFIFLFIYTAFIWIFTWRYFPETNRCLNPQATQLKVMAINYWTLLKNKTFIGYSISVGAAYAGIIAYVTCAPFIFQTVMGLNSVEYGWLSFIIGGAIFASFFINSTLVIKMGFKKMTLMGAVLMMTGGLFMLLFGSLGFLTVPVIMAPLAIYAMGAGLMFSNAFAGAIHPFPTMAGAAGALYGCLQILGGAVASLLMATMHANNQLPLAAVLSLLGIFAVGCWRFLIMHED